MCTRVCSVSTAVWTNLEARERGREGGAEVTDGSISRLSAGTHYALVMVFATHSRLHSLSFPAALRCIHLRRSGLPPQQTSKAAEDKTSRKGGGRQGERALRKHPTGLKPADQSIAGGDGATWGRQTERSGILNIAFCAVGNAELWNHCRIARRVSRARPPTTKLILCCSSTPERPRSSRRSARSRL